MTAPFSTPLFRFVALAIGLAFLTYVSAVFAADYLGPVFPDDSLVDIEYAEPLPLPRRNPLLQRPQSRQVTFDNLDPVGSVIPQSLIYAEGEEIDIQPQVVPQQVPARTVSKIDANTPIFMDNSEIIQGGVISEYPYEMEEYAVNPFPIAFGMGLFDNITLFSESMTFKTGLNNGSGTLGIGEGLNWSAAVTPQGSLTAQYGIRAAQSDFFAPSVRNQVFMTAGIFKRFDFAAFQGGAAVDWLRDHGEWGTVNLRQMRCELSTRYFNDWECGFLGGLNVFRDRPTTPKMLTPTGQLAVDAHDYYLLFVRKHLASGGQVELRCGSTSHGDFILGALGEVAISDRLAVNGGLMMLAPSSGEIGTRHYRESWSMSMGVVLYFRGGAMFRQANPYRPMFDVAGNNSFFTRMIGK